MKTLLKENKLDEKLTDAQRRALHLWFQWVADELNEQGQDMRIMATYPIKPTKLSVKEMIWKPIMLAMYHKTSTNDLAKQKEIDEIYDVICKTFGEMGIGIPAFPSLEDLSLFEESKRL